MARNVEREITTNLQKLLNLISLFRDPDTGQPVEVFQAEVDCQNSRGEFETWDIRIGLQKRSSILDN